MSEQGFPWGTVVLGIVAVLIAAGYWLNRRFKQNLRKTGITTLATIRRMEGASGGTSSGTVVALTLAWTLPDGVEHVEQISHKCELANMPQQGDQITIVYTRGQPALFELATDKTLRRDELPYGDKKL